MDVLLLHTCCAPCSAAIIERLMEQGVRPVLFYYNPNIYPEEEYLIRKNECIRYAEKLGLRIIDGDYGHAGWLEHVSGMEDEPERGRRCMACFRMRLQATARLAQQIGVEHFATTLASSRWKNLDQIAAAGHEAAALFPGTAFLEKNWRKDGLSERRRMLLEENAFYNQTWCGCEFSQRNKK